MDRRPLFVALLALSLAGGGCSSDDDDAAAKPVEGPTIEVVLNDEGCHPRAIATFPGPTNFHLTNKGSSAVTTFEIAEGEKVLAKVTKVAPGAERNMAVTLKAGNYVTRCPGGSSFDAGTLKVTGG
jgi:hypothetical protein